MASGLAVYASRCRLPEHHARLASGGGTNAQRETTNPAWDFQYIVPEYEVNEEYGFDLRAVFRPKCSREEVLEEYHRWVES